jgi:hypothetical protein
MNVRLRNLELDKRTLRAMARIYCKELHCTHRGLCEGCSDLLAYAHARVDRCPFGAAKTTCRECPIHCYKADRREAIREGMRHAGPKMLLRHPFLTLRHLFLEWKGARCLQRPRSEATS